MQPDGGFGKMAWDMTLPQQVLPQSPLQVAGEASEVGKNFMLLQHAGNEIRKDKQFQTIMAGPGTQQEKFQAGMQVDPERAMTLSLNELKRADAGMDFALRELGMVGNQEGYDSWKGKVADTGVFNPQIVASLPQSFDPLTQRRLLMQGMSIKDQISVELQKATLAVAQANLGYRGMEADLSQRQFERGAWGAPEAVDSDGDGIADTYAQFNQDTGEYRRAGMQDVSAVTEMHTQDAINRGVGYYLYAGSPDLNKKKINCSAFTHAIYNKVNPKIGKALAGNSDTQFTNISKKTGFALSGKDVNINNIGEGYLLFLDTGEHPKWEGKDRNYGIDHTAMVYRDQETGELKVAESKSGDGPSTTDAAAWIDKWQKRAKAIYATNPLLLGGGAPEQAGGVRPPKPAPTEELGKLIAARDRLPVGDPDRALYEAKINKLVSSQGMRITTDNEGNVVVETGVTTGEMSPGAKSFIEKTTAGLDDAYVRSIEVAKNFDPTFLEIPTRLGFAWSGLREKLGQNLSGQDREQLQKFSMFKQMAWQQLNAYIKMITGAQMSEPEALRILKGMPDPGKGIFDGDSPSAFQAKLVQTIKDVMRSRARYRYYLKLGISESDTKDFINSGKALSLEAMDVIVDSERTMIEQDLRRQGFSNDEIKAMAQKAVSDIYGL